MERNWVGGKGGRTIWGRGTRRKGTGGEVKGRRGAEGGGWGRKTGEERA